MRGFRTNRAMQNFKSSHYGNNQPQPKFKLIQGGLNNPIEQKKVNLPDWMKAPKSLIESQKSSVHESKPEPKKLMKKPVVRASSTAKAKKKTTVKSTLKRRTKSASKQRSKKAA